MVPHIMELVLTLLIVALILTMVLCAILLLCRRHLVSGSQSNGYCSSVEWPSRFQQMLYRLLYKCDGAWSKRSAGQRDSEENAILTNHGFYEEYTEPFTPEISSRLADLNNSSPETIRLPPSPLARNGNFRKLTNGFVKTSSFSTKNLANKRHTLASLNCGNILSREYEHYKPSNDEIDETKHNPHQPSAFVIINGAIKPAIEKWSSHRRKSSNSRRHSRTMHFNNHIIDDIDQLGTIVGNGKIKKAISCESVESAYCENETPIKVRSLDMGSFEFTLFYDTRNQGLKLQILGARNLEFYNLQAIQSCCFSIYLSSAQEPLITQSRSNLQDPVFGDQFFFPIAKDQLQNQSITFILQSIARTGEKIAIGKCLINLNELDILDNKASSYWRIIEEFKSWQECGDILISLNYLPTAERLTIVIVKAKNLRFSTNINRYDTFVKVYLLLNGKKICKKKTSMKKDDASPIFNESMTFSVTLDELRETALKIVVLGENMFEENTFSIGYVMLGNKGHGKALEHWNYMIQSMRKPISMWHALAHPLNKN